MVAEREESIGASVVVVSSVQQLAGMGDSELSVEQDDAEVQKNIGPNHSTLLSDPKSLVDKISLFFNQPFLSDVTLQVGDETYHAHRFILANSSDVLRTLLYEERWSEGGPTQIVALNETEDCQSTFEPFLKFLYTASVELNVSNVVGILCLADKYNVETLKHLCQNYMIDHCKSPRKENIHNALIWYPWSKALHLKCLQNQSQATIAWNAKHIMSSPDWLSIEYDFLQDMLKSSGLIIQSELEIFEAVEKWLLSVQLNNGADVFIERSHQLLPLVRFPMMPILDLHAVEKSELAKQTGMKVILKGLLGKAYRFHALCMAPIKNIQKEFSQLIYQPRDYLEYQVDAVKIHNTLRYAMQVEVKTSPSPLADSRRDADWKLSYRKIASTGTWSIHIQCHDATLNNTNAVYESTVIIYDTSDKIIQVLKPERSLCKRGHAEVLDVLLEDSAAAKSMVLLIKPVVNTEPELKSVSPSEDQG